MSNDDLTEAAKWLCEQEQTLDKTYDNLIALL